MKHLFSILFTVMSFGYYSQSTLDVNSSNLHPTVCDIINADTIRVDYNILYDSLTYGEMSWKMASWLIKAKIYDPCGNADYINLPNRFYRKKVIVIYSSLSGQERLYN
jgi:hypothetical protein